MNPDKPTTGGEWTVITVNSLMSGLESQTKNRYQVIADAHNDELAAERERYSTKSLVGFSREALIQAEREIDQLQKQLAAEEQKSQRHLEAANRLTGENIELEAQLAALAKVGKP